MSYIHGNVFETCQNVWDGVSRLRFHRVLTADAETCRNYAAFDVLQVDKVWCRMAKVTWRMTPWKRHLRMRNSSTTPRREPPRFSPPVSRFRTPAHFWCEMVTYQIWRETVKTGGLASKMSLWACFTCFQRCLCVKPLTVPITSTTSIINDHTFSSSNAVIHTLYQPFRVINPEYVKFLDFIHVILPTQEQVDEMERGIVLCPEGQLSDEDIWEAFSSTATPPSWPSIGRVCSESKTSSFAIYSRDGPSVTSLVLPLPTPTPSFPTNKCMSFSCRIETRQQAL